jgi:plastocyanin
MLMAACGGSGDGSETSARATPEPTTASSETPEETDEPAVVDGTLAVTGGEWSFQSPTEVAAGPTEVTYENTGSLSHELILVRLGDGPPLAELAELDSRKQILREVTEIAGTGRVFRGETSKTLKVDLKPGTYGLLCLLESPRGRTHAWVGMFKEISVR